MGTIFEDSVSWDVFDNASMFSVTPSVDPSLKPYEGQTFVCLEDAFLCYVKYASAAGFTVRRSTATKSKEGAVRWRYLLCNKEGKMAGAVDMSILKKQRPSVKCGCKARLKLKIFDGQYVVWSFVEAHNHPMCEDTYREFMPSNRKLSEHHQKFILDCAKQNIGATQSHRLYGDLVGGFSNVGATTTDFKNFARDLKVFISGRDGQMVINKFTEKMAISPGLVFEYELDDGNHISRLFWADAIARKNYAVFGDVVSFDATYETNKYNMVFAPFTGIDNHNKSVTFAAGLIAKEDEQSYVWLFECFKRVMGDEPLYIVTDQDPAMKNAFDRVFMKSKHRLCMWHIMMKLGVKVSKELMDDDVFLEKFTSLVWNRLVLHDEFVDRWNSIVEDYNLGGNRWFSDMFALREFWISGYFKEVGMSGLLRTTSRSESQNNWFGRFTNRNATLIEFFIQFDSAIYWQRQIQRGLDFYSSNKQLPLMTHSHLEMHAMSVYTLNVFKRVQHNISEAFVGLRLCSFSVEGVLRWYVLSDKSGVEHSVVFDVSAKTIQCTCSCFELFGLLCSHAFFAFKDFDLCSIPEQYVCKRWSKVGLLCHDGSKTSTSEIVEVEEKKLMLSNLWADFRSIVDCVTNDNDKLTRFAELVQVQKEQFGVSTCVRSLPSNKSAVLESFCGVSAPTDILVQPPVVSKNKGSGRSGRLKSDKEKAIEIAKKPKRLCRYCNEHGRHDSRNCPKKLADQAE